MMFRWKWQVYVLLYCGILFVDQMTKAMAYLWLTNPIKIHQFLELRLVYNKGITWGMFQSVSPWLSRGLLFVIVVVIAVLYAYIIITYKKQKPVYPEVCIVAAASSNLVDRLLYGGVLDYIHVFVGSYSFPIFNIADVVIFFGVIWMLYNYDTL